MENFKLTELRKERKIKQSELALAIGVAQSAISQWEKGINEPKASYLILLADYFNVSIDYLCGRTDY